MAQVDKALMGIAAMHTGLIALKGCSAILRKDYTNMIGKVKIVSSRGAKKDLSCTGFVGPGMLTAAILGDNFRAPPVDNILRVIEEVDSDDLSGVLLIVQNYAEYPINFTLAKVHAETKGYNVKLIIVNKNYVSQNFDNTVEDQDFLSMLFLYKIAGAMSEEGRNISEIYSLCHHIANSGEIALLDADFMNILREESDTRIFSNSSKQMFNPLVDALNKIPQHRRTKSLCETKAFHAGHEVAIMINDSGFTQVDTGVFVLEIIKRIEILGLKIKRIYVKPLIKSLNTNNFHICVLDLSFNSILIKSLDFPTSAPAWPRVLTSDMIGMKEDDKVHLITGGKFCKNDDTLDITLQGPMMSHKTGQIFLSVISMACKAIIACTRQLNKIDEEFGNGNYGTMLACGAEAIGTAIQENKILGTNPFVTFTQISYIIERTVSGIQGGLYSLFFHSVAKAFTIYQSDEQVTANMWLNALITANEAINQLEVSSIGDQTLKTVFVAIQMDLTIALTKNMDSIDAFGIAVKTAEHFRVKMNPFQEHLHPHAHAVGIWMRAAYEGTKLKLMH